MCIIIPNQIELSEHFCIFYFKYAVYTGIYYNFTLTTLLKSSEKTPVLRRAFVKKAKILCAVQTKNASLSVTVEAL